MSNVQIGCQDCGLEYGSDGWMDCIVSDSVWHNIMGHDHEGGILCVTCIAKRCARRGYKNVPIVIASGVLVSGYIKGIRPIEVKPYDPTKTLSKDERYKLDS